MEVDIIFSWVFVEFGLSFKFSVNNHSDLLVFVILLSIWSKQNSALFYNKSFKIKILLIIRIFYFNMSLTFQVKILCHPSLSYQTQARQALQYISEKKTIISWMESTFQSKQVYHFIIFSYFLYTEASYSSSTIPVVLIIVFGQTLKNKKEKFSKGEHRSNNAVHKENIY